MPTMLNLSVYTVETHRSDILTTLRLHSVPELILYSVRKSVMGNPSTSSMTGGTAEIAQRH